MKPKIVSLVGLTASGKSALGILLAQKFNGEIVSCDSRQVYRGLDIGTAKVTTEQRALVPHHLIDIVDPPKTPAPDGAPPLQKGEFTVYEYQQRAYAAIDDILARGKLPILVGGTGLYSRSVVEGYNFTAGGVGEVTSPTKYNVLQICLMPAKEFIRPLVEQRIDARLEEGMIEETRQLLARGVSRDWLMGLGLEYYWNVLYIEEDVSLDEYKKNLATKTMQYAKRQRTWFRREQNTIYLTTPATFTQDCIKLVKDFIR